VDLRAGPPRRFETHADLDAFDPPARPSRPARYAHPAAGPTGCACRVRTARLRLALPPRPPPCRPACVPRRSIAWPPRPGPASNEYTTLASRNCRCSSSEPCAERCAGRLIPRRSRSSGCRFAQQLPDQGPHRDPHRGFTSAGALQDAADRPRYLIAPVRSPVSRPGTVQILHPLQLVVPVHHLQRDRAARLMSCQMPERISMRSVSIRWRPAAAIAALTAVEFGVNRVGRQPHASWKTIHDRDQTLAVRFAGCPISQHAGDSNHRAIPAIGRLLADWTLGRMLAR